MSTTVTNTNPITITGGTMAAGARATIYPNQIKRSFKVTEVALVAGGATSTLTIKDNSTVNNVLVQLTANAAGTVIQTFPTPVTWGDWIVTALANTSDTALVYIK